MKKSPINGITLPDWIEVQAPSIAPFNSASLQYGAGKVAGQYAGISAVPTRINGCWVHGWTPDFFLCAGPAFAIGDEVPSGGEYCWVGTRRLEAYLRSFKIHAAAIGLPISYTSQTKLDRNPGSLLVMPSHSLDYTSHSWKFRDYAQQIYKIRSDFSSVVVCLHSSCIRNRYWLQEFSDLGIPVIEGANPNDLNSLERTRALLEQFEFVTTNGFGSHLAYASAFGAKVSIYGDYCEYSASDYKECGFYQENPGLADVIIPLFARKSLLENLPEFFSHPLEAKQRLDWGLEQIGWNNRISPAEMRRCFGWDWYHEPLRKTKTYFHIFANRLLTRKARQRLEEWKNPGFREENQEIRRIQALPPNGAGTASLAGLGFHFGAAGRFLGEYTRVFQEKALDVPCIKGAPRIVDWGAGEGMPMRYWAQKFPSPVMDLHEPDAEKREILKKNMTLAKNAQILLHDNAQELQDLLQGEIDFLRVDMGAEGIRLLERCGNKISCVDRLLVTCRSQLGEPQNLSILLAVLERQGFRYHISPRVASANPLVALKTDSGVDGVVDVWGYRGDKFPRTS